MKKINFKDSSFIIFASISILYFVGNFIWWCLNTPAIPTGSSVIYFSYIFKDGLLYYAAPLLIWIMKVMFFIFGAQYFDLQVIFVNYILFLIALYFVYKIGLELKNKETGNIAMLLFALTPAVYGMSRQYGHQDWQTMIAMTANIYCLIKLNGFKDKKWSILYGITVGLGLLIKDAFLMFFFIPWLYTVIRSLVEKVEKNKAVNILITIILGASIAGIHYFRPLIIYKVFHEPVIETVQSFYLRNLKIMTIGLSEYLLSPPIFILFIVSLIWFIFKYKNKNKIVLLLWFIIPWITIVLMPTITLPEYGTGFIPAIVLIISIYISHVYKKILKFLLIFFVMIICSLQFLMFSYGIIDNSSINADYKDDELPLAYFINVNYTDRNSNFTIQLLEHLNKYKDDTLYIEMGNDIDILELKLLMILKGYDRKIDDIFSVETFYDKGKGNGFIEDKSISILARKELTNLEIAEYIYQFTKGNFNKSPEHKKQEMQEILNKIDEGKKYVKDNFYFIEDFYWGNIEKADNLIKIYKKK